MHTSATVSVLIPSFNRAYCLPRALDSVLEQSHTPLEIIVVDDGSTDDTAALLADKYPNVRHLEQRNQGVSAARNTGIAAATGDWIALLDSDDAWHPRKLEKQLLAAAEHPDMRLVHCDELWIRNGVRVNPKNRHQKTGGWIFEHCLPLCAMSPSASMIRRDVFDDIGLFDTALPACEDYDFWLRLTHQEPVLYIDEALLSKYGGHEDQLSRAHWGMDRFRIQVLLKLLRETPQLQAAYRAAALDTLKSKIAVYSAGARKRGRDAEADDLASAYAAVAGDIA